MKYKESIGYYEENHEEEDQQVYPQEIMEPDESDYDEYVSEEIFEEDFEETEEFPEEAFEIEEVPEKVPDTPKDEAGEEKEEHLTGFGYVSLKNEMCRVYMSEEEGDPCQKDGKECPLQFVDENGEFRCRHSLIKTEKDYEECERLLIEYRREQGLNRSVLLRYFPGFDTEGYLTDEGKAWLLRRYEGSKNG